MILQNQKNNNAQLCENEETTDKTNDRNKEISLKKESKPPIEIYDIYP